MYHDWWESSFHDNWCEINSEHEHCCQFKHYYQGLLLVKLSICHWQKFIFCLFIATPKKRRISMDLAPLILCALCYLNELGNCSTQYISTYALIENNSISILYGPSTIRTPKKWSWKGFRLISSTWISSQPATAALHPWKLTQQLPVALEKSRRNCLLICFIPSLLSLCTT